MMEQDKNDQELEAFFAAELADAPRPSATLMAAVLADADAHQPELAGFVRHNPETMHPWRRFRDALGGWGGLSALSACLILGVSVGYVSPDSLSNLTLTMLDTAGIEQSFEDIPFLDDVMAGG